MPQIQFDQFPLQPFLDSLETDGIRLTVRDYERIERLLARESNWTLLQLRDALSALLVKDEEQQLRFNYRFDQFLQLPAGAEDRFADVEVDKALIDLKELANTPQLKNIKQDTQSPRSSPSSAIQPKKKTRWYLLVYGILCLLMLGSLYFAFRPPPHRLEFEFEELDFGSQGIGQVVEQEFLVTNTGRHPIPLDVRLEGAGLAFFEWDCDTATPLAPGESRLVKARFIPAVAGTYVAEIVFANEERSYEKRIPLLGQGLEPIVEQELPLPETPEEPAPERPPWQMYAGLAGFFLFATLLYGFYLWRKYRVPKDEAPIWDENGPRHFPLGSIGGEPPPWLDDETLDYLADTMGYFQTRWHGRNLDVPASINATLQQGGLPDLVFQRRHEVRSLLILEDRYAEATEWNHIPEELALGMRRRGIPVIYGTFAGDPDTFTTDDGSSYHLEDFEDERRGILLLLFTDGKGFYGEDQGFALEALARWPMAAWMELRDIRFWDESTALSTQYKLPIYPATETGLMQVLHRFLTERGTMADYSFDAANWQPNPILTDANLTTYLQEFLGDAYLWAADCAMIQPITPALAQRLRETFHNQIPPSRIERLWSLPFTRNNVSGMRFHSKVLQVLRNSFMARREELAQGDVISFIFGHIEMAEPALPSNNLAHMAWETVKERFKLEFDRENDLKRLEELASTPLRQMVLNSLDGYGFSPEAIPYRVEPKKLTALYRYTVRLKDITNQSAQAKFYKLAFRSLINRYIKSSWFLLNAHVSKATGDLERALEYFQLTLRLRPDFLKAPLHIKTLQKQIEVKKLYELGQKSKDQQDWVMAQSYFLNIQSLSPNYPEIESILQTIETKINEIFSIAKAYYSDGNLDKAEEELLKLEGFVPAAELYQEIANYREEAKKQEETLDQEFDILFQQGNDFYVEKDWNNAIIAYKKALSIRPSNSAVFSVLARAERRKKDALILAQARQAIDDARWRDADYFLAQSSESLDTITLRERVQRKIEVEQLYAEGRLAMQQQDWLKAQGLLDKAVSLEPNNRDVNALLVNLADKIEATLQQAREMIALGQYDRALMILEPVAKHQMAHSIRQEISTKLSSAQLSNPLFSRFWHYRGVVGWGIVSILGFVLAAYIFSTVNLTDAEKVSCLQTAVPELHINNPDDIVEYVMRQGETASIPSSWQEFNLLVEWGPETLTPSCQRFINEDSSIESIWESGVGKIEMTERWAATYLSLSTAPDNDRIVVSLFYDGQPITNVFLLHFIDTANDDFVEPSVNSLPTGENNLAPTSSSIPDPIITNLEISPDGLINVEWRWEDKLDSNQNFTLRMWPVNDLMPDTSFSIIWTKETSYQFNINDGNYESGMYSMIVSVVEGSSDGEHTEISSSRQRMIEIP